MKRFRLLIQYSFIIITLVSCGVSSQDIYVSHSEQVDIETAKDLWFTSIPEAIQKAKLLKQKNNNTDITIHILDGEYYLDAPMQITPELSNLKIIGSGADKVVIKGSKVLGLNWKKHNDKIWVATISENVDFDQLFVNGNPQILARYPNYDEKGGYWNGYAADAIDPKRISKWKQPKGALIHAMHSGEWGGFHYEVTGVDSNGELKLKGGHQNNRPSEMHITYRMVENMFEELDSPGEWFFNKEEQQLYLWPQNISDLNTSKIEVATQKHLINIVGTEQVPVQNVTIEGLRFEHTARTIMETYEPLLRSDWTMYRGGAIFLEGTKNNTIKDCELTNLGGNVIFVSGYNRNVEIKNNHIHNCGASAVSFVGFPDAVRSPSFQYGQTVPIKEMDTVKGPKSNNYPSESITDNNLIYDIGRLEKQSAGVQIAMASHLTVSNNSIYNVPRAGINVGDGTWGGHIIEYNDVFNTVLESSDHGAFNSWGRDRFWHPNRGTLNSIVANNPEMPKWDAVDTTIIRNNRFSCDHGWDIDLDDGSSNYHIYNNVCLSGGIKLREGFYRTVENNITINNGFHPHVWFKNSGDIFRRNIVFTEHKNIQVQDWGKEVDYNFFPNKEALEESKQNGVDKNSSYGDVLFVDAKKGNYNLQPNSAAYKIDFKPFETTNTFGVKDETLKKLAQKPEFPKQFFSAKTEKGLKIEWLGAKIKNVETMAERSASGLNKTAGVLILFMGKKALLNKSDIQNGDVIVFSEGVEVNTISDLMKSYQGHNWKGKMNMRIFRNQKEQEILVFTK